MFGLRPRTLWLIGVIAALFLIVLTVLPIGAARLLEGALRDRGATEVSIDDMDINLFDGTVDFYDVVASNASGRLQVDTLEVEVLVRSVFASRFEVLDFELSGGHLDLIEGSDGVWQLGSLRLDPQADSIEPVDSAAAPAWGLGAHRMRVENLRVTLQSAQLTREFELHSLDLQRAFSWQPTESLEIELSLHSREAELDFSAEVTPFDEILKLSGDIVLKDLRLQDIQSPTLAAAVENLAGTANTELEFSLALDPGNTLDLEVEGEFGLLGAVYTEQGVQLEVGDIGWSGAVVAKVDLTEGGKAPFEVSGDVYLAELRVRDEEEEDFEILALSRFNLVDMRVTEQQFSADELTLEDVQLKLQRLGDGQLRLPGQGGLGSAPEAAPETEPAPEKVTVETPPYSVRIGQIVVSGESEIHVRDEHVNPVFTSDFRIIEMQLSDVDSVSEQPMKLSLIASSSNTDQIEVIGSLAPFVGQPDADLAINLEGFDLSRFSSYVPGYNLERGRLALTSVAIVTDGELDVQNKVIIDKLKLAGKTDGEDELVAAGAAMPLDVMLDLLRDSDDRIALEIPVTGTLESFEVGFNQVIRKATQAALQKAAMSYVKSALQPLGTILFAANLAGKAARPRFEPVLFNAGESQPTGEHVEYLNKISGLLKKRPALGLTLCGVATTQDEIALTPSPESAPVDAAPSVTTSTLEASPVTLVTEESLLALAKARADAVKTSLTSQGADVQQLYDCRPSFERADDSLPRVEVML